MKWRAVVVSAARKSTSFPPKSASGIRRRIAVLNHLPTTVDVKHLRLKAPPHDEIHGMMLCSHPRTGGGTLGAMWNAAFLPDGRIEDSRFAMLLQSSSHLIRGGDVLLPSWHCCKETDDSNKEERKFIIVSIEYDDAVYSPPPWRRNGIPCPKHRGNPFRPVTSRSPDQCPCRKIRS